MDRLGSVCRSCMSCSESPLSSSSDVLERLWECTGVRVGPEDEGLPSGLCAECVRDLDAAHLFRARCRRSDELLRKIKLEEAIEVEVKCELDDNDDNNAPEEVKVAATKRKKATTKGGSALEFRCGECAYTCRRAQTLRQHARKHTGERPFACAACPARFAHQGSLVNHARTHDATAAYACDACGKRFKVKSQREKHRRVHEPGPLFVCAVCDKGVRSKEVLRAHLNRHNNVRDYACDKCGATFVTGTELAYHARTHSAHDKRFACAACPFRTHCKANLERHAVRHTQERKHKCNFCGLLYFTSSEMTRHRRKHTQEKNYACPICDARFSYGYSVNVHALKIHGVKYSRLRATDRRTVK